MAAALCLIILMSFVSVSNRGGSRSRSLLRSLFFVCLVGLAYQTEEIGGVALKITQPIEGQQFMYGDSIHIRILISASDSTSMAGARFLCMSIDDTNQDCEAIERVTELIVVKPIPGRRVIRVWVQSSSAAVGEGVIASSSLEFVVSPLVETAAEYIDVGKIRSVNGILTSNSPYISGSDKVLVAVDPFEDSSFSSSKLTRARMFDTIYKYSIWTREQANAYVPRSGSGSSSDFAQGVGEELLHLMARLNIRSILDLGCGDMTWMAPLLPKMPSGTHYTGVDISAAIIAENQESLARSLGSGFNVAHDTSGAASSPTNAETGNNYEVPSIRSPTGGSVRFMVWDVVEDGLPCLPLELGGGEFDLIFCRHVMIHFAPEHNLRLLEYFSNYGSNSKEQQTSSYLMATTFLRADSNLQDYTLAFGHLVNLFRPPYNVRDPRWLIADGGQDMFMGVWELRPNWPLSNE